MNVILSALHEERIVYLWSAAAYVYDRKRKDLKYSRPLLLASMIFAMSSI